MNSQDLWKRYCQFLNIYPDLGFTVDISRMRFDDDFVRTITPSLEKAFSEMERLEKGEIVNPDENRMVGHYWLRSPKLAPTPELQKDIASTVDEIRQFASQIHGGEITPEKQSKFKNVLLIGIGGSALGPQLLSDAMWNQAQLMRIFFIDNTDPDGIARTFTEIGAELDRTLCIVISKSGGTVETRNGMLEAAKLYADRGLTFGRHAVAITCRDSGLDQLAEKEGWRKRFYMGDWVGGRTSLFSAVGLLPAALQGIDIASLLAGAAEMDEVTRVREPLRNPAAVLAMTWYWAGEGRGKKDMVVLPYKDRLMLFSKYLQQLVMESLGKEKDLDGNVVHQGIAVYGNKGSTDQHAYVQQLRDGVNNFFVTFIEVLSDYTRGSQNVTNLEVEEGVTSGDYLSGFLQGTRRALYESNRESVTITLDELTPRSLGALIALYERTVGLYATLVNINAYHQPGVEAGKKAAATVIDLQKKLLSVLPSVDTEGQTAEDLAGAIDAADSTETVYKILEHLAANDFRKVERVGQDRHPQSARYRRSV